MKHTGKVLGSLLFGVCVLFGGAARADLIASVDRDQVQMGDSLTLTITATGNERIGNLNHRPLLNDFEILQRSSSSSTRIVNGQMSSERKAIFQLTPRRTGTLNIPPLSTGDARSNFLMISVTPQSGGLAVDQTVSFEAELDRDSAYVQSQVILTLRIMQSVNLESRSVTELQLDNAFVKPLEQKSFQRTINGRPWLVYEIRYAIFPEESGILEIPAQTFAGRESSGRRSMLGFGNPGRQVRRTTKPLQLKVLPRPDSFPGATWLPARNLEIRESWSTPPEQLHTGESATRAITIVGEGLQGAQLPPTLFPPTDGLKYYPDQPMIEDTETSKGLVGTRTDSAALIPTREGRWTIPEVKIPWWDTEANKLRYAVLPERTVIVSAGAALPIDQSPIAIVGSQDSNPTAATAPTRVAPPPATSGPWKLATLITSVGWLLTLAYLAYSRRRPHQGTEEKVFGGSEEKRAYKALVAACAAGNAAIARREVIRWAATVFPERHICSLDEVAEAFVDPELSVNLERLNKQLYSDSHGLWRAGELADIVDRLRKAHRSKAGTTPQSLALYPS